MKLEAINTANEIHKNKNINTKKNNYQWISRNSESKQASKKIDTVFCLTLYNEELDDLLSSLVSISQSLKYCQHSNHHIENVAVYIISDGYKRLSESVICEAKSMGWVGPEADTLTKQDGLHIFESVFSPHLLLDIAQASGLKRNETLPFNLYFCIKPNNKGKLDSHWWFFKKICEPLNPQYCFQIDAGTRLQPHALQEMLNTFNKNDNISAVASEILIESTSKLDLLESFQCMDFVVQRSTLWPVENLCGYMSVVPGQFCGINWTSLSTSPDGNSPPIDRYLAGLDAQSAQQKIMFLAEDRVMSFELLTDKGSDNRNTYAGQSECYTDACHSVDELLKQRRRWINSAFTCRSWMLLNFSRFFRDSGAPLSRKLQISCSMASMIWMHVLDFFQPLLSLLIITITAMSFNTLKTMGIMSKTASQVGLEFIIIAWMAPTVLSLTGTIQKLSKPKVNLIIAASAIAALSAFSINVYALLLSKQSEFAVTVFLPFIICPLTLAGSALLGKNTFAIGAKTSLQYFLCSVPVYLMLYTYAFTNMSDSSWGTKGLTRQHPIDTGLAPLQRALNRYAKKFVATWLLANAGVFTFSIITGSYVTLLQIQAYSMLAYFCLGLIGVLYLRATPPTKKSSSKLFDIREFKHYTSDY